MGILRALERGCDRAALACPTHARAARILVRLCVQLSANENWDSSLGRDSVQNRFRGYTPERRASRWSPDPDILPAQNGGSLSYPS